MISLEQVQLLESKVAKAIEYVRRMTEENAALISEKAGLVSKLDANQKRLDELELLIMRFKEDQGRIEDGIIAALDRLNQFEEAFQDGLKDKPKKTVSKKPSLAQEKEPASDSKEIFEIPETDSLGDSDNEDLSGGQKPAEDESDGGELDIF